MSRCFFPFLLFVLLSLSCDNNKHVDQQVRTDETTGKLGVPSEIVERPIRIGKPYRFESGVWNLQPVATAEDAFICIEEVFNARMLWRLWTLRIAFDPGKIERER